MDKEMNAKAMARWLMAANLLCLTVMFGMYVFYPHYATDDYNNYYCSMELGGVHAYVSMRPIVGIVWWILAKLGINFVRDQVFFGILLLFSMAFLTTKLTLLVAEKMNKAQDLKNIVMLNMGSLFLTGNAFTSEYFWYASSYIAWMIAFTGVTLSLLYLAKEDHLVKNSVISLIWLFIAVGSYQVIAIQYAAIVLFIVYMKQNRKIDKAALLKLLRAALILMIAMACNMLIAKPIGIMLGHPDAGTTRVGFDFHLVFDILHNYIMKAQPAIWIDCMGTLPRASMLMVCLLLLVACTVCSKHAVLNFIWAMAVCFTVDGMIGAIQILQGWFYPTLRTYAPIFSIVTIFIWMNVYNEHCMKKNKIVLATGILFLAVNFIEIQVNAIDVIKTNTMDKECIRQIDASMQSYENRTGIQINKIGFIPDASRSFKYDVILSNHIIGDLGERAFVTSWSDCNSIRFYTGRELQRVDVPEPYASQLSSADWTAMQLDEQMIFDHDAVYIAVY